MQLSPETKQSIYDEANTLMHEWYGDNLAHQGACLYWTQVTVRVLSRYGLRPVLQAGDMLWQIIPDDQDDGQMPTHFGYSWSPEDQFSREAMAKGLLPEVHIWVALPDERCLVDFSTSYLPEIAKARHGFDWLTPPPPQYVFGAPPSGSFYRPDLEAIRYVWGFIAEKLSPEKEVCGA